MRYRSVATLGWVLCAAIGTWAEEGRTVRYGTGSWSESLGNHRAVVQVDDPVDAVRVHLPWRRRDAYPERKAVWVTDAADTRIANVVVGQCTNEVGDVAFQPTAGAGSYHVYFLPYRSDGWWAFPTTVYLPPEASATPEWLDRHELTGVGPGSAAWEALPPAALVEIQAINDFNRMDPMELPATAAEMATLRQEFAGEPFLLYAEDRRFPIVMRDAIPWRWVEAGPGRGFEGEALRGEFYTFQMGVFAWQDALSDLTVTWTPLQQDGGDATVPKAAIRCTNAGGIDCLGNPLQRRIDVPAGQVQPLWLGIDVPATAVPGVYRGTFTVTPGSPDGQQRDEGSSRHLAVILRVGDEVISEHGDHDLWRQARLRWLDSTIGLNDDVYDPYTPVVFDRTARTASVLGRSLSIGPDGLPSSIRSTFSVNVDRVDAPPRNILAGPMHAGLVQGGTDLAQRPQGVTVGDTAPGRVSWTGLSEADGFRLTSQVALECDGAIDCRITVACEQAGQLEDVYLEIPVAADVARTMLGLGHEGGIRPESWDWAWDINRANNHVWLGDVNAGIQCKLKNVTPHWAMYGLQDSGLYRDWAGEGKGGITLRERGDAYVIRAFTGPMTVHAGQELHFNLSLLITPLKILDKGHWQWRVFHRDKAEAVERVVETGATIINLHQGDALNPHINYPFATVDALQAYTRQAHQEGMKVRIYYTVRELSNYTAEFWALRSLGDEIFRDGPGFQLADHFLKDGERPKDGPKTGSSWLCEHAVSGYAPAWHQPLGNGHCDAAVAQQGLSRWHNYYLEGLSYLIRNVGIDGLYLDGIGYDREIMKRVRKVMQQARPGCLIDFHSGNNFHPQYGLNNVAGQYMELFPCIDGLWFGEGFDYNKGPDYWLVEISGLPYGLFGEMLQGGGNPWRGMLYGMTNRLGWGGDPRALWKVWDAFGIEQARMMGYWDPSCPVKTGRDDVLATAYVVTDGPSTRTLVALASWAEEPVRCRLEIDYVRLGLHPESVTLYAPEITAFQPEWVFAPDAEVPVSPGRGWLLWVDEQERPQVVRNVVDPVAGLRRLSTEPFTSPGASTLSAVPGTAVSCEAGALVIQAAANHVAYVSRPLPAGVAAVACEVAQGTDKGATWGPGVALAWESGAALRVNIRAEGRFGVYGYGSEVLEGSWFPNGETFHFVLVLGPDEIQVRASTDGSLWQTLAGIPRTAFPGDPVRVSVGKMGIPALDTDHGTAGPTGTCKVTRLEIFGQAER